MIPTTSDTVWYVEPRDAHTNKTIAVDLAEESAGEGKVCSDGYRRPLWRCSHDYVARLLRSKGQLSLRFNIFVQHGPHGVIRPWKFEGNRRKRAA